MVAAPPRMRYPSAVAPVSPSPSSTFSRRLLIASIVFGVFVVTDILLFGWLIFRSLSEHEVQRVLLETQEEAKNLAERIASGAGGIVDPEGGLYVVMAKQREVLIYIESELAKREIIEDVSIYDQSGTLVYSGKGASRKAGGLSEGPILDPGADRLPGAQAPPGTGGNRFEVEEAIGSIGRVRIGLSPAKVLERAERLRKNLLSQMVSILVLSLLVLVSGYVIVLLLFRRARRLEEQARDAERMAYIGTLAAGLAHEIRNPLNSLNLNMQMLAEELGERAPPPNLAAAGGASTSQRLLNITRQEISRLEQLVTDFLLYAKPRAPELSEIEPVHLLTRVRDLLAGEAEARGARLRIEDGSGGARVRIDAAQMTQLLLNLAQNALAATEQRSNGRPEVVLAARLVGDRLALVVEDNGVGMSPEEQKRIFEAFYSTKKGGTGLGLAVVERIARAHGGSIEVESVPGKGTAVAVALPVASFAREPLLAGQPTTATGSRV